MLQRFLLVWLLALCGAAYFWTSWFPSLADPFAATKPILPWMFAGTMFLLGGLLPHDDVRQVARRWPAVLGGTAVQYAAMPLLAWSIAHLLGLEGSLLIGVVLVGCVPGAMASNVITLAAGGNVSYSVSLTTAATLLSPVVVPLALSLTLGASRGPDPGEAATLLLLQVVGPVVAGHLLSRSSEAFSRIVQRIGPPLANLTILWIIAVVVSLNRERLKETTELMLAALLLINLLGYAAGYLGSTAMRLPSPMRRALTLEVGMQNAGLGTVLAQQLFPDRPEAAIPTAAYTFGCMLTGTVLAQIWSRFPHARQTDEQPEINDLRPDR